VDTEFKTAVPPTINLVGIMRCWTNGLSH